MRKNKNWKIGHWKNDIWGNWELEKLQIWKNVNLKELKFGKLETWKMET